MAPLQLFCCLELQQRLSPSCCMKDFLDVDFDKNDEMDAQEVLSVGPSWQVEVMHSVAHLWNVVVEAEFA
eukprot:6222476-Amphidinium_carterae.1